MVTIPDLFPNSGSLPRFSRLLRLVLGLGLGLVFEVQNKYKMYVR